jgi:stage III sporulation protein AD
MKTAAIAYITQFVCDICSDAGEKAIAAKIDMAGKVIVAVISSPIILALMEAILKFI